MHTSSGKKTQPSASCISASLRRALSIPCRQEFGCAAARILCHFCASTLAEQPASGCPTCLSVHCRAIFVLHRQAGTAGTNHCPCLQITRANKAPAGTRTSSPENSSGESPVRAASMGSGSCRLCTLVASQQRFLRCSALAKSHGSLLVCSDSCGRAVARQHTQAHLNPVRGACSALQACCFATSTPKPQPHTHRRANEVACHRRQARGAGELQGEEERFWTHGCSLLFDFFTKVKNAPGPPRPRRRRPRPLR